MLDYSRRVGSLGASAHVVLMIVGLFDGKLFIRKQNSLPVQRCDATRNLYGGIVDIHTSIPRCGNCVTTDQVNILLDFAGILEFLDEIFDPRLA